jgi:hypothetical protein
MCFTRLLQIVAAAVNPSPGEHKKGKRSGVRLKKLECADQGLWQIFQVLKVVYQWHDFPFWKLPTW